MREWEGMEKNESMEKDVKGTRGWEGKVWVRMR